MNLVRGVRVVLLAASAAAAGGGGSLLLGACGPFTDVSDAAFCPFVLEIFTLGITTGVTPTTYEPATTVNRLQMAAFLSRTVDGLLNRSSRRAAAGVRWTPSGPSPGLGLTTVGLNPVQVVFDGLDVWVSNFGSNTISRVRSSSGNLLGTWTGADHPVGMLSAMGAIFATSDGSQNLYRIDPKQATNAANIVATVANFGGDIVFDGGRIWLTHSTAVSIVTPGATLPWTVTTVTTGFTHPLGAVFDGSNVWITDSTANTLLRLDANGAILQTVTMADAGHLVFDGENIWAPNPDSAAVTVVRASTGAILRVLTGNGLGLPQDGAFDGERVVLASIGTETVSVFKATDLSPLGFFGTGASTAPAGICSDGIRFWVALDGAHKIAQF